MKIAFDGKRFFSNSSGLGNYSRDLVRVLANYFPENDYILLNKSQSERGREILDLPNVSFKQIAKGNFSRQLKMGKDAQKIDADIFHGLSGELPLKWDKKPMKKIVTIHDLIFERFPQYYSFFDRKMHLWKFRKAVEKADVIIAISEQTKRDVIHYLKVPESKVKVVYQGCHQAFKEFIFPEFLNQTKEKYNLPERFILNVGTIEERKNLLNVIKALKATKIPLVVVGKKQKKYFQKIEKEIRKNGVEVQFLENVNMNELAAIYRLADIFIYPSLFEGFGIPVIEALFSGTPVITSNVSCLPEAGGKNSTYVNPLSVEDIRSKVLHLWENQSERKRRREKSFEYVQQFKDEVIAQELMKIYKEIL
ncbi:glycosyltransferase family 4 protein [Candidatus Kaistella beijingensis]|uniref:glycosyltransferase family 4 protein n=1 Tax=Candidatus Kaistella beijingensis TaxID=2820270 RepID=UPI001CC7DB17|nr:glycosyltransferase family 1 protein [Candidatus Kaistella beijingensis]UBB90646.1 glycosyltransferase family 4 protein [Candidatus Kaistella beijingensis]